MWRAGGIGWVDLLVGLAHLVSCTGFGRSAGRSGWIRAQIGVEEGLARIAWTETIFLAVLVTSATAAALYGVLARFERPPAQIEPSDYVRPVILSKTFLLELQRLHPFIHHHRPSGGPKFLTAMYHIKKFLYRGLG